MKPSTHIDRYDNPEEMWAFINNGTLVVLNADENQVAIMKDGRTFEISPDYFGRKILRINEVLSIKL